MKLAPQSLWLAVAFVVLTQRAESVRSTHEVATVAADRTRCKELNQFNCYAGKNEGIYCNRKDQTKAETRWWHSKGVCRRFTYKGCNGNRNRFCTQESCEKRCNQK